MRLAIILIASLLLAGCQVVFVPVPVQVNRGITIPATLPTPTPASDVARFKERYAALEVTYDAMRIHMEAPAFDDADWRAEAVRLAREWHDAIDVLSGTAMPEADKWWKVWPSITSALSRYGFAADGIEEAATRNDPAYMQNVRSYLIQGVTFMGDAMQVLGED